MKQALSQRLGIGAIIQERREIALQVAPTKLPRTGCHPSVGARAGLARVLGDQGDWGACREQLELALASAEKSAVPEGTLRAQLALALVHTGDGTRATALARDALREERLESLCAEVLSGSPE